MDMGKPTPGTRFVAGPYDTAPPSVTNDQIASAMLEQDTRPWARTDKALWLLLTLITLIVIAVSPAVVIAVWKALL